MTEKRVDSMFFFTKLYFKAYDKKGFHFEGQKYVTGLRDPYEIEVIRTTMYDSFRTDGAPQTFAGCGDWNQVTVTKEGRTLFSCTRK